MFHLPRIGQKALWHGFSGFQEISRNSNLLARIDPAGIDFGIGLGQRSPVVEATRVPFGNHGQALT